MNVYSLSEQEQRDIATAALAGWRFVRTRARADEEPSLWDTFSPDGSYHGTNALLQNAARYALANMEGRAVHDPAADMDKNVRRP